MVRVKTAVGVVRTNDESKLMRAKLRIRETLCRVWRRLDRTWTRLGENLGTVAESSAHRLGESDAFLQSTGVCPTCSRESIFVSQEAWLRDHFLCSHCGSLPRERALMTVLETRFPEWRTLTIHESSPGNRGASKRIAEECPGYIPSQFYPDTEPGSHRESTRCENLEALTFEDESIDIHVSQDVLEHVFRPSEVFREIARTLKPGGAHIFTVPLVNKHESSRLRARLCDDGEIDHLLPAEYHGNPIDDRGSLVTVDWGFDIAQHIFEASGLNTEIVFIDDLSKGIRAEFIEVLVTRKPTDPAGVKLP